MNGVEFREYKRRHWDEVCELHDRARPVELEGSCDKKAFVPLAMDSGDLQKFNASKKYVAYYEGTLVGFAGYKCSEITWLYVEPDFHGKGIGRQLLKKILSEMPESPYMYALGNNVAAIQLYKSEGFWIVDEFQSTENGYKCTVLKLSR